MQHGCKYLFEGGLKHSASTALVPARCFLCSGACRSQVRRPCAPGSSRSPLLLCLLLLLPPLLRCVQAPTCHAPTGRCTTWRTMECCLGPARRPMQVGVEFRGRAGLWGCLLTQRFQRLTAVMVRGATRTAAGCTHPYPIMLGHYTTAAAAPLRPLSCRRGGGQRAGDGAEPSGPVLVAGRGEGMRHAACKVWAVPVCVHAAGATMRLAQQQLARPQPRADYRCTQVYAKLKNIMQVCIAWLGGVYEGRQAGSTGHLLQDEQPPTLVMTPVQHRSLRPSTRRPSRRPTSMASPWPAVGWWIACSRAGYRRSAACN